MNLYVGLDVSSEKLDVCFLSDDDHLTILEEITLGNDMNGATAIKEKVIDFQETYDFHQVIIGMESTSMYSFHPAMFFNQDKELQTMNTLVTIENPFRIKQFSRMFDEDKTDRNDAFRIADFLRIQRFTTSPIKEEKYMALQRLTRTRYQLVKQLIRTKQHFLKISRQSSFVLCHCVPSASFYAFWLDRRNCGFLSPYGHAHYAKDCLDGTGNRMPCKRKHAEIVFKNALPALSDR